MAIDADHLGGIILEIAIVIKEQTRRCVHIHDEALLIPLISVRGFLLVKGLRGL